MSSAVYFAPTYFSPDYFPQLPALAPGTSATYRDRDAFLSIVGALDDTGEFADIILASSLDRSAIGADRTPLAVILPTDWSEIDDVDPIVNVRQVTFTLTLVVRDEDARRRFQLLDRLTSLAQNAIDGSALAGGCLPDLTKLRKGRFDPQPKHPEQRVTLSGSFSYLVSTHTGHDTTP